MAGQTKTQNTDPTPDLNQGGPIWGYRFAPNQRARSITSEEAVKFLTAPGPALPDEFCLVAFFAFQRGF